MEGRTGMIVRQVEVPNKVGLSAREEIRAGLQKEVASKLNHKM